MVSGEGCSPFVSSRFVHIQAAMNGTRSMATQVLDTTTGSLAILKQLMPRALNPDAQAHLQRELDVSLELTRNGALEDERAAHILLPS